MHVHLCKGINKVKEPFAIVPGNTNVLQKVWCTFLLSQHLDQFLQHNFHLIGIYYTQGWCPLVCRPVAWLIPSSEIFLSMGLEKRTLICFFFSLCITLEVLIEVFLRGGRPFNFRGKGQTRTVGVSITSRWLLPIAPRVVSLILLVFFSLQMRSRLKCQDSLEYACSGTDQNCWSLALEAFELSDWFAWIYRDFYFFYNFKA